MIIEEEVLTGPYPSSSDSPVGTQGFIQQSAWSIGSGLLQRQTCVLVLDGPL